MLVKEVKGTLSQMMIARARVLKEIREGRFLLLSFCCYAV